MALQAALDLSQSQPMYLPPASSYYKITSALTIPGTGAIVIGSGYKSIIRQATVSTNGFEYSGATIYNCTFRDVSIGVAGNITGGTAFHLEAVSNSKFFNCQVIADSVSQGFLKGFHCYTAVNTTQASYINEFYGCDVRTAVSANARGYLFSGASGTSANSHKIFGGTCRADDGKGIYVPQNGGGAGGFEWEFRNLPVAPGSTAPWLKAHNGVLGGDGVTRWSDGILYGTPPVTGELDGILYGTPPETGDFYVEARVHNLGDPYGVWSDWHPIQLSVRPTAEYLPIKAQFAVGVPVSYQLEGTGSCALTGAPAWVDVQPVPNGCVVMGRAPISGEYYNFSMPGFSETGYPGRPIVFSGEVGGAATRTRTSARPGTARSPSARQRA